MTEKRFTQKDEDDWEILDRNKHFAYAHSAYQAEKIIQELNELVETNRELYKGNKQLKEENEQLKQQLKSIENNFEFCCSENHIEFNKDEINVKDTHTELKLKDGKLYLSVFIPKINGYFKFFYVVTGRRLDREFIKYGGDIK